MRPIRFSFMIAPPQCYFVRPARLFTITRRQVDLVGYHRKLVAPGAPLHQVCRQLVQRIFVSRPASPHASNYRVLGVGTADHTLYLLDNLAETIKLPLRVAAQLSQLGRAHSYHLIALLHLPSPSRHLDLDSACAFEGSRTALYLLAQL